MTVSAAQVTFAVSCVSGAIPSQPTLTVPLSDQTYTIPNDQWIPSGDQSSPSVYLWSSINGYSLIGLAGWDHR
jgi:hypothetical protein